MGLINPELSRPVDVMLFCQRLSTTGGVPIFTRTLATALAAGAVSTSTCSIRERLAEDRLKDLPATNIHMDLGMPVGRPSGIIDHLRVIMRLSRCIARQHPATIHTSDSLAPYVFAAVKFARLRRAPSPRLVVQAHEPFATGMMGRPRQRLVRAICRRPSVLVVADVPSIARQLEADLRLPENRVESLALGVDTDAFDGGLRGGQVRNRYGIPPGAIVVCYIARPAPVKNHQLFFEIARRIVTSHQNVWFITTFPDSGRHGNRVIGIDSLEYPQDLLFDADIYLSTSDYEGFGLSIVEAMAAGLAVVAASAGSVAEVVGDTALLAPAGAADELTSAVVRLLDEPDTRAELARLARERARMSFGLDEFGKRYVRLLAPSKAGNR